MDRNDREQGSGDHFRSADWFDRPGDPDMTARYIERCQYQRVAQNPPPRDGF